MSLEKIFGEDSLSLEKIRLIGLIERGDDTPETQEALKAWTIEMENRSCISSREMIRFNVDRAAMCEAWGDIDGALECLYQARYQTNQEKDSGHVAGDWEELLEIISRLIYEMEDKYPPVE